MEMIIFVGLPGSGKSTYYKNHFFNSHLRISNDLLKTKNRSKKLLDFCKETNMSFVVDNTNVSKADRAVFIKNVKSWQQEVYIRCIYFKCNVETCLERNKERKGKDRVPDCAIYAKAKILEAPCMEEGFDEIYRIG